MTARKLKTNTLVRSVQLDRASIDTEARTCALSFSSELPYARYFGDEILDHSPKSIRLGRLKDGGALLLDHDPCAHIGVVESVDIGEDRTGRAVVRFGRNPTAESAFIDVQDGIRQHVSVSYLVHKMQLEKAGKDTPPVYRVTDWEPLEISLVAIPADPTVGVGRAFERSVETIIEGEDEPAAPATEPEPTAAERRDGPSISIIQTRGIRPMEKEIIEGADAKRAVRIAELGDQYSQYVKPAEVAEAIRAGSTVEAFQEKIMAIVTARHQAPTAVAIGLTPTEKKQYSLSRAIAASMAGDWRQAGFERECSEAAAKVYGRSAEGFWLPPEALARDFTAGTSSEAGNLIATELRDDLWTDVLRNALSLGRLGVTILTGLTANLAIPRKTAAGTVAAVNEIAAASETQPTTAQATLQPNRVSAFVQASKRAIIQSSMSVEALLRQDLVDGTAVLAENYAINGTGTAPQPRGIRNVSGIGSVVGGTNGANIAWSHIVGLESACANSNAEPDQYAGYLINTKSRGTAKTTQKATNLPFMWDNGAQPLNGYRAAVTNNVPSNLTKGSSNGVCSSLLFGSDWRMLVVGFFGGLDVTVDPYTQKNAGMVEIAINAYMDVACRLPASFAAMDDALTP